MLAVAVANVSQKPPVDLDKSSQFDDINIESGGEGGCGPGARKAQGPPGGPSDLSEDEKVKQKSEQIQHRPDTQPCQVEQ